MFSNNNTRILLRHQVVERVGYSIVHVYRLMERGLFPRQVRLGANRVGWVESEIEAWLASKIAARDSHNRGGRNPCS